MKRRWFIMGLIATGVALAGCASLTGSANPAVCGTLKKWHTVTLTFDGPQTSEQADPNPFTDCRMEVTFCDGQRQFVVPGYYAADGQASQSSADGGNKWRAHFCPDKVGKWTYHVSFRTGPDVALSDDETAGKPVTPDGLTGVLQVGPGFTKGLDLRSKGRLQYVGKRYLQWAETGEYFIKGGADSPENMLGYADFDGTFDTAALKREGEAQGDVFIHRYAPHVKDWQPGDPTWGEGKGKGLIGGLNYLSSKGVNSIYFIPYNIDGGDGKDVWPWTDPNERMRFDCSKLDQWEIVFSHAERMGIALHMITQEQENDQGLDAGELGPQRRLYYRELIARFGHHLALVWNLGEENTNTNEQRKAFCRYLKAHDPYDHPVVCHTFPGKYDEVYRPLLAFAEFDGPSLQTNDTHNQTILWIDESAKAGRPWFVCLDEIGPAHTGVKPDQDDYWHDEVRAKHLWGNLMAGGAGVEWYFGYKFAHNDLNCEDWRSRDHMWDLTRYAVQFFHERLPFVEMDHHDELTAAENDYCFAKPGQVYAVYLPNGGTTRLDLGQAPGEHQVHWYNPRTGGPLQRGTVEQINGPGTAEIGQPPAETNKDWVALVTK